MFLFKKKEECQERDLNLVEISLGDSIFSIPRSSVSPVSGFPIDLVRSYPRLEDSNDLTGLRHLG